jgi:cytochrome P450
MFAGRYKKPKTNGRAVPLAIPRQTKSASDWDTFNYDHRSSKVAYDPVDLWDRLQAECPVSHSDKYGGFWFVSRYDDVMSSLVDWETFSSAQGVLVPAGASPLIPMEMDPPLHRKFRALLNPAFSPKRLAFFEGRIRSEARAQIAALDGLKTFEVCEAYARPFPKRVAIGLLGFPADDLPMLDHWISRLGKDLRDDPAVAEVGAKLSEYLSETLKVRAKRLSQDDLIGVVQDAVIDGQPISHDEQISMLMLLLFGGLDTTTAVLAGALGWLADHPEDRVRLRAQPELFASAAEEFVRFTSPASHMSRVTTRDTEIAGCPIGSAQRVMLGFGAANRDRRAFKDPNDVILDRHPNRHLGFGAGPHRCVGSHLGKLQVRIGLEEFLARFENFEIDDRSALRWEGAEARALAHLPLRVT